MIIPEDRLPPGFAEKLDAPSGTAAEARPAATVVLLRDADAGPETFLLRRNRTSGFVPGAYVFPGGRVDADDGDPSLLRHAVGLPVDPPAACWMAAVRETFEETGVLLARTAAGAETLTTWREALLEDRVTLPAVLEALDAAPDFSRTAYIAHWITPVAEPRRFDTRFFLAAVPHGTMATPDAREMSDAVWITPAAALDRFREGRLPMVFPTVRTLEGLAAFDSADGALDALRGRTVPAILPRLVRRQGGIGIVIDAEES